MRRPKSFAGPDEETVPGSPECLKKGMEGSDTLRDVDTPTPKPIEKDPRFWNLFYSNLLCIIHKHFVQSTSGY